MIRDFDSKIHSFELAGLPGVGKSMTAIALRKRLGDQKLRLTRLYTGSSIKTLISLPLIPFILIRFYRVFILLITKQLNSKNIISSLRVFISILGVLCSYKCEHLISSIESYFLKKQAFLDGGYIQWSISIWLRSPVEIRNELWSAYLSHIPNNIVCVILECDSDEALRRAKMRVEGVPSVMSTRPWSSPREGDLACQYRDMSELLRKKELQEKFNCFYIQSTTNTEDQASNICVHVKKFIALENLILY